MDEASPISEEQGGTENAPELDMLYGKQLE